MSKYNFNDLDMDIIYIFAGSYIQTLRNAGEGALYALVDSMQRIFKMDNAELEAFFSRFDAMLEEIGKKYPSCKTNSEENLEAAKVGYAKEKLSSDFGFDFSNLKMDN